MDIIKRYTASQSILSSDIYTPQIFNTKVNEHRKKIENLLDKHNSLYIYDEIDGQLRELIKSLNPSIKIKQEDYPALIKEHLNGQDFDDYGVWVYYPWSQKFIHTLDEEEFIEIRTNRNRYKITREEQQLLRTKKIGVIGLSVGQSIALTLAMERTCGELRLADFDTAELSNLNRIRTGLHNLGVKKTIIAAREIAEIDPFIKVKIFSDGLTTGNMDDFFEGDGKLDLLVEVCDGLDIKIQSRYKARSLKIPVVMDTNDRGMLDVERFDLQPDRPVLHGLADGLDPENIKDLSNEEKIPYILKMVGIDTISTRLKASMMEVEQSINTWPQLASSVTLGGALTTDVCRRILLDQYHDSGRYYIDLDELVEDKVIHKNGKAHFGANPYKPLEQEEMQKIVAKYFSFAKAPEYKPAEEQLDKIIDAAIAAPSAGNNQPWKWYYSNGILFLFHDKYRSWSWGDYYEMGSHMALGAALENVHLEALKLKLEDKCTVLPIKDEPKLIAVVHFATDLMNEDLLSLKLADNIFKRTTNRKLGPRKPLPAAFYDTLQNVIQPLGNIHLAQLDDEENLTKLGGIIASCDRIRLLNEQGHEEFFNEVRWTKEHAEEHRDGIELASVELSKSDIAGFQVAQDWNAVELLAKWNKGDAFKRSSVKTIKSASAMLLFSIPEFDHSSLINAGRAIERVWIFANLHGISVHPMLSPVFFFNRMIHGKGIEMEESVIKELKGLREEFVNIFPLHIENQGAYSEVFLMKLSIADDIGTKSLRKPKKDIFYRE